MRELRKLTITDVAQGRVSDLFDEALEDVLSNLLDPKAGDEVRKINLEIAFKPAADGKNCDVKASASVKLAKRRSVSGRCGYGFEPGTGQPMIISHDIDQPKLFDHEEAESNAPGPREVSHVGADVSEQ